MRKLAGFAAALALTGSVALAKGTKINGVTYENAGTVAPGASAKDQLPADQALRLKKIFLFPTIDDLSGALAPKLDEKVADLFMHNTRFEVIRDPQVVKALSPDESTYYKAALNADVHKEAARVTGADTTVLLRTRNVGPDTRMTLEFRDARGNLLYSEEGTVPGASNMETRGALIEKLYRGVLSRLPFEGTITGRTAATLTVDLGMGSMRLGEEIEIARIVSVQRHPLLGTVVGVDYVRTGRAKVTSVDRVLSFATVIEEFPGEKISPGQKVLRAQATLVHRGGVPAAEEEPARHDEKPSLRRRTTKEDDSLPEDDKDRLHGPFDDAKPRYGQLGADLYYGSLSHSQTFAGTPSAYSGSGIAGDLNGELWVTKNWILSAEYGFQSATLKSDTQLEAGSTSWNDFRVMGGYRIFPEGVAEGFVITGSLGYDSQKYDVAPNTSLNLGAKKFTGFFVQADGDIYFLNDQKIAVGFSIEPFGSLTEPTGTSLGTPTSGSVIGLHLAWQKRLFDKLWLQLGLRYSVANGNYEGDNSSTVTDKRFAIGPGVFYQF